jgi:hypothetical protein
MREPVEKIRQADTKIWEYLKVLHISVQCAPKGPLQCKRCRRFGHTQRNCGYAPRCVACGHARPSETCVTSKQQLKCCSCGGNHTGNYNVYSNWKEARRVLQWERNRKDGVSMRLSALRSAPPKPSPEEEKQPQLEPRSPKWPRRQGSVHAQTYPTSSSRGRRAERQVAPDGDQCRRPCAEV